MVFPNFEHLTTYHQLGALEPWVLRQSKLEGVRVRVRLLGSGL
jgi:hypothetical protein